MGIRRTTAPAAEPLTLAEAKLHLRVDTSDEDAYIGALISAARIACEERIGRTLINSTWTLTANSWDEIDNLPYPPVISITSVSYVSSAGSTIALPSGDYMLEVTDQSPALMPTNVWPEAKDQLNAVTVVYTAGYGASGANVPAPIRQWILLAIGDMYAVREQSSERPVVRQDFAVHLLDPFIAFS